VITCDAVHVYTALDILFPVVGVIQVLAATIELFVFSEVITYLSEFLNVDKYFILLENTLA